MHTGFSSDHVKLSEPKALAGLCFLCDRPSPFPLIHLFLFARKRIEPSIYTAIDLSDASKALDLSHIRFQTLR